MKNLNIFFATLCCLCWSMAVSSLCTEDCKAPGVGVSDMLVEKVVEAVKAGERSLYDPKLWPEDYAEQVKRDNGVKEVFDFIVVGSGTAGSVVASRLSENSSIKVLLLEAGGDPPKESEMSLIFTLFRSKYMWNDYAIRNENSCQALVNESCYWPHGKMIGGTGGANGNLFLTGSREDYDNWTRAGNKGWSWNIVKKYFSKALKQKGNESHPMGGLTLNYMKRLPMYQPVANLMYQAAEEMGLPVIESFDGERYIGISTNIKTTTEKGRRMSTAKTYIARVTHKRPNLKVIKNAFVKKIRFDQFKRAVGVDFTIQGVLDFSANVSKEVILSAGALSSPKILMHSGIGPKDHLQSLGIPVLKNLKAGENLQDHGIMPIFFKINNGTLTTFDERSTYQNILNYFLYSEGPLADTNTCFAHINSHPNSSSLYPDMQILSPQILSVGDRKAETSLGLRRDIYQFIESAAGNSQMLVLSTLLMKPQTRGSLKLRSTNVLDAPLIDYEYGKHDEDKAAIVRFVRYLQRMQTTKAFKAFDMEIIHPPLPKCADLADDSDEYWLCYAKYFLVSSWHAAGTCKMGPQNDTDAVVDARLRVHGVRGVRVIDASIMPNITYGNTNGPTIMIGEKGAAMVLLYWKKIGFAKKLSPGNGMRIW